MAILVMLMPSAVIQMEDTTVLARSGTEETALLAQVQPHLVSIMQFNNKKIAKHKQDLWDCQL